MKKIVSYWNKIIAGIALFTISFALNAQIDNFEISIRNVTQGATTNVLEFDVYLLDTDPVQTFELASIQLGFLFNSLIYTGGTISVAYDNTGSGLNASQQFNSTASFATSATSYPDQTLVRLAGRTPPGAGNGTIISATGNGTLITHFIITSTVNFSAGTTPDLVFCPSTATTPLYPTRVSQYQGTTNTALVVTPGTNAIVYDNPVLNPPAPVQYTVNGGGSYCEGGSGVAVGLSGSEAGVTYTLIRGGTELAPTVAGTGSGISFGNQTVAGTYTVEGTNAGGTTTMAGNAVVTVDPLPVAAGTISGTAAVCQGTTGVTYTVPAITNATSYQWAYSGTGETINGTTRSVTIDFAANATSGNLTVRGVNACGNGTYSTAYPITVNSVPAAAGTISGSATVCQGQSAVSYSVPAISGATNYLWSYSGSGASISGSSNSVTITFSTGATGGNLTVRGENSCGTGTVSSNFAIAVNPLPGAAGTISGTSTVCQGQSGVTYSVSAITGATSYSWAYTGNGATITGTTNSVSISFAANATSGNLTVRGVNSCGSGTVSAAYPITVNALPGAAGTISGASSVCQGQSGVTYTVGAISAATSYLWAYSGAGATLTGTSNSVSVAFASNATSGNLTVTGVNSCGSGTISATYPVTVNALPGAAGTITGTASVCRGTSSVAYSVPSIANATSYSWSYSGNGATIHGTSNSVTIDFAANASSGTLTVQGVNSCGSGTVSAGYGITVNALPTVNAGSDASIPNGTSTTLTGTVTGTSPFTYSWTPAASVVSPASLSTSTVNLSASTTFTLTATSTSTGCSNSDQVTITVTGGALSASATATPASICAGSSTQLAANASGGSGTYGYSWTSNPAGFTSSAASPTVSPTVNTTYYVTVDDTYSTVNSQVAVTVTPVPTITGTTPASRCGTGTVTLSATASAGTINWYSAASGGSSLYSGATFTTPSISSTTTYYVDATNNSCTTAGRTAVIATVNPLPTVNAGSDVSIPNGTSTTLTGTVTGTSPFTYSWTPAASVVSPANLSTSTVNLSSTTTFTLTATSTSTGCVNSDQVIVTISGGALAASATATPNIICAGSSTQLAANATGGSGTYDYSWTSNPAGFTSSAASPTVSPTVNTTYYVTVDDGFSSANSQVAVTVNPVPTITGTTPASRCGTGTVTLSATASAGTINWYSAVSGGTSLHSGSSFTTPGISSTTTYYVDATNNSCTTASRTAVIATVNALPVVNAGADVSIANGTSTTLTGTVTGTSPFTYSWTPAASVVSPANLSTSTVNLTNTTTFTLTATSTSTGCLSSDQVTVTVTGGSLSASATATPGTICAGSSTVLAANASGGSGTYTYAWTSNPAGFTSSAASPTASPTANTIYSVTVNDGFNSVISQVTVTVNAVPAAPTVGQITQPTCTVSTGSVVLSGLPSGTWTINPGNHTGSTTSTTITGLTPGSYTFTVTNSSGCTSPASSEVVINTQPAVPSRPVVGTVTQPTCAIATGSVELSGLPSTGTWTLRQYPGGTTSTGTGTTVTVTSLPQGTYNFSVENEGGCISMLSDNAVINAQPPTPAAPTIGTITQPTYTISTGSVTLNGLPSGTWTLTRYPDEVEITGSGTSRTISGLEPGTYSFTVMNSSGCISASSANVVINPRPGTPDLFITNPPTICSNETADLTLPAVTAGSEADLTFSYWTDLMATVTFATPTAAPPGTYYIKGTNPQNFYAIKPVVVTADELPVPNAGPDQVLEYVFGTTLEADIPLSGTGLWTLVSGTGQIFNSSLPSTAVSGLSLGDNIFSWTITNGACDPVADFIVIKVNNLIIPTLITPNQDGRNDTFVLRGLETMGRTDLTIFDRRGLKVYENSDYDNSWEGLDYNNNPLPDDTYFYVIRSDSGMSISGYIVVRR